VTDRGAGAPKKEPRILPRLENARADGQTEEGRRETPYGGRAALQWQPSFAAASITIGI